MRRALRWLPLAPIAVAVVAHSLWFDFVCDDAYISFVYARNLAEHGELVFNLGDRTEGYTNFLWTVLLAGLLKLGWLPEHASRVLGALFAIATLPVVVVLVGRARGRVPPEASPWGWLAAALLAASSGYACWASGGLETQLFTFLVTLGIFGAVAERPRLSGLALALAALTRPEGVLVFAAVALHRAATRLLVDRSLRPRREDWIWAACFLAIWAPYWGWRWWYYGWPFPNTFYVKAGAAPSTGHAARVLEQGAYYAWQWATQSKAIYALPLALVALWRHRRLGSLALLVAAVYLVYTIRVGGDFMGLHRFVLPLFVLAAILAALGLAALVDRMPAGARIPAGALAAAAVLAAFTMSQVRLSRAALVPRADRGIDRPGYLALYAHDRERIGRAMAPHVRPDDFAIFGGAGVQPYHARLRGIDVFGLVSEDIAHHERPVSPRPGHQKWGSPERVLAYRPTLILHCYDLHHDPRRYRLCGEAGRFRAAGYEPVTIHVPGLRERGEYYTFLRRKDRRWP